MTDDVWKRFEQNNVTHSAAHHLSAIASLHDQLGYARVSDVARALNITRGSASLSLKALKQRGWVEEDQNRFLLLSNRGTEIVRSVKAKRVVIEQFLGEVLGLPAEVAEEDTCKIEHLLSMTTAKRLAHLIAHWRKNEKKSFVSTWASSACRCVESKNEQCPICAELQLDHTVAD
jgi:Mn-dependent DtxR family transcriptional regulator